MSSSILLSPFWYRIRLLEKFPKLPNCLTRTNSQCQALRTLQLVPSARWVRTPPKMPPRFNVHTIRSLFCFLVLYIASRTASSDLTFLLGHLGLAYFSTARSRG